ncbi:MAG: hypothetical protein JOZ72_05345 [Alphaproteobacteria bacterium]|nr:hypothetical protein [Alphaproteobacteria bacterium]
MRVLRIGFLQGAAALSCLLAVSSPAAAAQLVAKGKCSFVEDVPGMFGSGTHLNLSVAKGALFTPDGDKFCGMATMDTPFGPATSSECFAVAGGQLVSGRHGNKIASSDCALVDPLAGAVAFDPAQGTAFAGSGPANLRGQAFLKTVGGDVKTCAGEDVFLMPSMPYFDEAIEMLKSGIEAGRDERAMSLLRHTLCDAQGNFSFSGLPAKKWWMVTQVRWGVPHIQQPGENPGLLGILLGMRAPPDIDKQGGELIQAVELKPGDNQAFLTDRDER